MVNRINEDRNKYKSLNKTYGVTLGDIARWLTRRSISREWDNVYYTKDVIHCSLQPKRIMYDPNITRALDGIEILCKNNKFKTKRKV